MPRTPAALPQGYGRAVFGDDHDGPKGSEAAPATVVVEIRIRP